MSSKKKISKLKIEFHLKPSPFLIFVFLENWIFRLSHFFWKFFRNNTNSIIIIIIIINIIIIFIVIITLIWSESMEMKDENFFFCSRIINMNENVYRNHNNYYYHYHHHHEINIGMKLNSMIVWASDQCTHPKLESISYR